MLDNNDLDFTRQAVRDMIKAPKFGEVVSVYEHRDPEDFSNFEVDVIIDGTEEPRAVPYHGLHSGQISPPKVGDNVLIVYREGANRRPVAIGTAYTNDDRAPLGRAGMYRQEHESGFSPAGTGNLKLTGYTKYNNNPAFVNKNIIAPEETWIQIAKEEPTPDPADHQESPMVLEMYDSAANDESHITLSLNVVDNEETDHTWGVKLNAKTGEFKIVDGEGYGIESDGQGNFTWHYKSIDYSQDTTTSL